jgi:hypothetical protein
MRPRGRKPVTPSAGEVYGWEVLEAMEQGCQFGVGQASQIGIGRQQVLVQARVRTSFLVLGSLSLP